MSRLNEGPRPVLGERRRFVADSHDAGASIRARESVDGGWLVAAYWLTPSGATVEEGRVYEVEWQERFRTARSAHLGDTRYALLKLRGGWTIVSEALSTTPKGGLT